ncbi:DNA-directed primase / polymerase protein [Anaeramoeba flamelloides]|uniref:DNA-directed primase/polymerase protein n=1 Tax=Anaeramoeba flamelloides TaxID=1746091 RepID=A0AAV7ZKE0_9EUKA|nr:DNA-directed primase / polymerase protein [Anaeramoeba flamelloides]
MEGITISVVEFYGKEDKNKNNILSDFKRRRVCAKRITKQENKVINDRDHIHKQKPKSKHVHESIKTKNRSYSNIQPQRFKSYRKQKEAFEIKNQLPTKEKNKAFIFSCEKTSTGKRIFYTLTYDQFWELFKFTKSKQRHFNEVICEGSICNLYYDLEFLKQFNPNLDGDHLVEIVVNETINYFNKVYGINLDHSNFIILDSSTNAKYSSHVILRMKNIYFKNSIHTGRFVCSLLNDPNNLKQLLVHSDNDNQTPFIDLSVYSKNRNFRLFGNSKFGKSNFFKVSKLNKFQFKNKKDFLYFSLVSNAESNSSTRILKFSKNFKINALNKIQTQNVNEKEITNRKTKTETKTKIEIEREKDNEKDLYKINKHYNYLFNSVQNNHKFQTCQGAKSNSEVLDQFINDQLKMRGNGGIIYSTSYDSTNQIISYVIMKDRYCQIAGRFHKSNHIILSVDLNNGVWYQRCFDIDCRGHKANIQSLPKRVHCVANFEISNPISFDVISDVLENDHLWPDLKENKQNNTKNLLNNL